MSKLSVTIENQRTQRIASWTDSAIEYMSCTDNLGLAVPSILQSALSAHTRDLFAKLSTEGMQDGEMDRITYRKTQDSIYTMVEDCSFAWASSVLTANPNLAATVGAIAATMLAIAPSNGSAYISEKDVMTRLYVLDTEMNVNSLEGGANDWHEITRAYQTVEAWFSPGYLLSLRTLIEDGRVDATVLKNGSMNYRHTPMLYNWAVDKLAMQMGAEWTQRFMVVSMKAANAYQEVAPAAAPYFSLRM